MGKMVFVISGGAVNDPQFLYEEIRSVGNRVIICADGAAQRLKASDITPDFIVGDMDSIDEDTLRYFEATGSRIIRYPGDKDETDTQLALECAFGMNPDEIRILGALGGRVDHTLANISLLVMCVKRGVDAKIVDKDCELLVVDRSCVINGREGETVSLIPLSSDVRGITLEGFRYPLSDGLMEIGKPYGVSNRLAGTRGTISVKSGYLLVIRQFEV
ncbi:MAG: thiamine diphosphokinase [Deltaproteobacteria bacterium]|nr:thiamine diphosphokinase [Deltaproteobacteria bacterium]